MFVVCSNLSASSDSKKQDRGKKTGTHYQYGGDTGTADTITTLLFELAVFTSKSIWTVASSMSVAGK